MVLKLNGCADGIQQMFYLVMNMRNFFIDLVFNKFHICTKTAWFQIKF